MAAMHPIASRWSRRALIAAVASVGLGGAAFAADPIKVRIGYQSLWGAGGEIVEVLRNTNILELNGLQGEFKTFTFGGPLAEAAVAGEIDNVFAADAPVLRAMARMPGSKILQFTHDARFGILVEPNFTGGLTDLKGKKLSAPFATTTFPRAMKAIVAAGIARPFQEMTIINQDIAEQTNSMQAKLVDAVTTWDPTMERLIQQKLAKVLWVAPRGENMGMQGFTGKWLEANGREGAVRFLKAWIMATWWASNNIEQARTWFGATSRLPPDLLKIATEYDRHLAKPISDIKTIDLTITEPEIASTQGVMDFLFDNKLLNAKLEAKPYFDMGPVKQAQAEVAAGKHPDLKAVKVTSR